MFLLSAPEQDTERVWHLLARSNRSQSAAGGKGVDVDGMRTGNGCVPSLRCRPNLTDGFLSPPESVRATALTLRWLYLSFCFAAPSLSPFCLFSHSFTLQTKAMKMSNISLSWATNIRDYFYQHFMKIVLDNILCPYEADTNTNTEKDIKWKSTRWLNADSFICGK